MNPTIEQLREAFDYDPATGVLTWRVRPRHHFATEHGQNIFNAQNAGRAIFSLNHGYVRTTVTIDGRRHCLYVHRVAWALMHGEWPEADIDHRDLDTGNNRASNLRAATPQQNFANCAPRRHSKLGIKGVRVTPFGRFTARIRIARKEIHLGTFDSMEGAIESFRAASIAAHGEFARFTHGGATS